MSWVGHNYKIHNKEPTPESYSKEVLKVLEKKVLRTASGPKKHKYEDEQQLHHWEDSQLVSKHIVLEERNESVRGGRDK